MPKVFRKPEPPETTQVDAQPANVTVTASGLPSCRQCGAPFAPNRAWQVYCGRECSKRHHSARRTRRRRAVPKVADVVMCQGPDCHKDLVGCRKDKLHCSNKCRQASYRWAKSRGL